MGQTTVTQFAGELKMPASALLEQLQKAGVDKTLETDLLSEQDKARLLDFLRRAHGDMAGKSKITLTRKQTSEIRATDSTGRPRTVQVEVCKKRTFVKRDETPGSDGAVSAAAELVEPVGAVEMESVVVVEPVVEVAVEPAQPEPVVAAPVVEPVVEVVPEPEPAPAPLPEPVPEPVVVVEEPEPVVPAKAPKAEPVKGSDFEGFSLGSVLGVLKSLKQS